MSVPISVDAHHAENLRDPGLVAKIIDSANQGAPLDVLDLNSSDPLTNPLSVAIRSGEHSAAMRLLTGGATPTHTYLNPFGDELVNAATQGFFDVVVELVDTHNMSFEPKENQFSPFHEACIEGHGEIIEFFLKKDPELLHALCPVRHIPAPLLAIDNPSLAKDLFAKTDWVITIGEPGASVDIKALDAAQLESAIELIDEFGKQVCISVLAKELFPDHISETGPLMARISAEESRNWMSEKSSSWFDENKETLRELVGEELFLSYTEKYSSSHWGHSTNLNGFKKDLQLLISAIEIYKIPDADIRNVGSRV